jgi:two-component system, chemotaxis family, protein-glutamate methylesterase/glutaminase
MNPAQHKRAKRILVIDDSPVFGRVIADLVARTPDLTCVGLAEDASSTVRLLESNRPDAVLAGFHLPYGDLTSIVGRIQAISTVPVIAIAPDTPIGAELALNALGGGAVDFVVRPDRPDECDFRLRDELRQRLRLALDFHRQSLPRTSAIERAIASQPALAADLPARWTSGKGAKLETTKFADRLIVMGAGIGGPGALLHMFARLALPLPPIVIAQPLASCFVRCLAARLAAHSQLRCLEAQDGDLLEPDTAYLAPARRQTIVVRRAGRAAIRVRPAVSSDLHSPSIDVLMQSAAITHGGHCLGVLLSGSGRDGVEGARAIAVAGGFVLGQDQASSYLYGTSRLALERGYIDRQFHLDESAEALSAITRHLGRPELNLARSPLLAFPPHEACAT